MKCSDTVRAFVAVEISDEVRQNFAALQFDLKNTRARVKWVRPGDIHLTLAFLGDIFGSMVSGVSDAMDTIAETVTPFSYEVSGIGFFGRRRSPRVIWVGAKGNLSPLMDIQARLTASLRELKLPTDDKPFVPHLTLARIRSPQNVNELVEALESRKEEYFGQVKVDRMVLFGSQLKPDGPCYTVLHESRLWNSD